MAPPRLYDFLLSGSAYKVRLLLAQLDRPFEHVPIDSLKGKSRSPEDPWKRAQIHQWLFLEQYSHEPYLAVAICWHLFGRLLQKRDRLPGKLAGGRDALRVMEQHLSRAPFFVGARYSVADIPLYAYTHVAPEVGFSLDELHAVRRWIERVCAQPGQIPITAEIGTPFALRRALCGAAGSGG